VVGPLESKQEKTVTILFSCPCENQRGKNWCTLMSKPILLAAKNRLNESNE
jgi:hypothetical protein